jgi:hypothetical protein
MASSETALSSAKRKGKTKKERTTRTRTQTEKGKYNMHNQNMSRPKRIAECSESKESSEEETHRPTKKCLKVTEEPDSEVVDCHTSSDIVEVTSSSGGKSNFQVSAQHSLLSLQEIANE